VWAASHDTAKQQFRALRNRYLRKPRQKRSASNFTVLTTRCGVLTTRDITLRSALQNHADVSLNYGDDFSSWSLQFIWQLKRQRCGVTILRGEPGTGKTTYLRYLTRKLRRTHRFYYLPLTVYPLLSNPSAVDFWMIEQEMYPKLRKIVILEDAESLLMERASDNQASVSNLLNISDGFLGDVLRVHVICTINCPIDRIDPALLRPGRLVAMREFARLSATDATALARAKGLPLSRESDCSLAEIYNSGHTLPKVDRIGFGRT
jgi:Cdc6-like AAA superfamily ATPase